MKNAAVERNAEYDKIIKELKDRIYELEQRNVLDRQRRYVLQGELRREDITPEERADKEQEQEEIRNLIIERDIQIEGD